MAVLGGGKNTAGCWWLGGRGWTVTFRTSLADRKDKKKKEGEKLLFPAKDAQVLRWLTFGATGDGGIHLSIPCPMNYSLAQRSV